MRPLMVLGCTSDAGKSLLVTALCRWFARNGVSVAPFKAQNMSNNARVVAGVGDEPGGEIGVAQWLQAHAARVEPAVRMNPVLLKPEADTRSQVVVRGTVDRALSARGWQERHDALWTPMAESFDALAADFDLVVIEGAGSPAEINLRDQVNNRMVAHADAAALLVSDIDRGGSFAHLFGTWSLVPESTRDRLAGFVLNRFRGDASLLEPGPSRLTEMTGMANAGVVPMLHHGLPREEGAAEVSTAPADAPLVVLPRFPFGSNLDEFHLLRPAGAALLLKTIEAPPPSTMFVICADFVPHELITISSRCAQIDFRAIAEGVISARLLTEGIGPLEAQAAAKAALGDLDRARLLAPDPGVAERRAAFVAVPTTVDGSGTVAMRLAAELLSMIDASAEPLAARHAAEVEALDARIKEFGERGSGKKQLEDRHKRELRRQRTDELRGGLAAMAASYRDRLVAGTAPDARVMTDAVHRIHAALDALERNPNERLLLEDLIWSLPAA